MIVYDNNSQAVGGNRSKMSNTQKTMPIILVLLMGFFCFMSSANESESQQDALALLEEVSANYHDLLPLKAEGEWHDKWGLPGRYSKIPFSLELQSSSLFILDWKGAFRTETFATNEGVLEITHETKGTMGVLYPPLPEDKAAYSYLNAESTGYLIFMEELFWFLPLLDEQFCALREGQEGVSASLVPNDSESDTVTLHIINRGADPEVSINVDVVVVHDQKVIEKVTSRYMKDGELTGVDQYSDFVKLKGGNVIPRRYEISSLHLNGNKSTYWSVTLTDVKKCEKRNISMPDISEMKNLWNLRDNRLHRMRWKVGNWVEDVLDKLPIW